MDLQLLIAALLPDVYWSDTVHLPFREDALLDKTLGEQVEKWATNGNGADL